ncbi:MAG: sel1 repeat family protein, partial [Bacteroidota bacterium]|nr:sel1 repeat family protein [Bacteroidota bacterium]
MKSRKAIIRRFATFRWRPGKDSMHSIGSFYYSGEGVAQNYSKAKYWYLRSAQLGHMDSMCDLGRCYQRGVGVRKNQRQALLWFTKAVKYGSICAMTWMGLEYSVKPIEDWPKARHWLEKAAEHQQSHAMYLLGIWAESGWTDGEKIAEALFWFNKAALLGHNKAALH